MDENSLAQSIELYKSQLEQVEAALSQRQDEDKSDLLQLQGDLREVIQLTEESLLSLKKSNLLAFIDDISSTSTEQSSNQSSQKQKDLDDELLAFKGCLLEDVTKSNDVCEENNSYNLKDEKEVEETVDNVDELCGTQCRLLYSQEWGASQYHNAIVLNTENQQGFMELKVRVLFCNPTHTSMIPCPYFMEGSCKFSESNCRFSHGHVVNYSELENFKEPDFSNLETGSKCFAKYDDSLWHRATVEDIELEKQEITVTYNNYNETATLNLDNILPLECEEYLNSSESEDDSHVFLPGSSAADDRSTDSPVLLWQPGSGSAIGEWEKHTLGIGSKLMLKMGYEFGKGLGKNSEGRVEPVEAVIVPQGKSLDHCMELKEAKKLKIVGKKKHKGSLKPNQLRKKKENVFDFINSRLGNQKSKSNQFLKKASIHQKDDDSKPQSSSDINRGLNIKLVQTQEEIRKVEKHLVHKKNSLHRNTRDKATAAHIQEQIIEMERYLTRLKSSESKLQKNQDSRKQHKKLTVF